MRIKRAPEWYGFLNNGTAIILLFSFLKLLLHLYTNAFASYGYFRDEFYYITSTNHLDFGYVDHPPLSVYILAASRHLLGDSLFALRFLPAVAGAATIFLTGIIARKLGGGGFAITISCLSVIVAPIYLAMNTFFSMNCFDILFWALCFYIIMLIIEKGKPKHWVWLGIVLGLGLLNKIGMLWFGFGLLIGLLLTHQRKHLKTKWPYVAAVIAFAIFSPYVIWNITHDYPHIEFIKNATILKYAAITPGDFVMGQFLIINPVTFPIWLAGLYFYFFTDLGKKYNLLGIIFVTSFVILLLNGNSKSEYLATAYPPLLAGGSVMLEKISIRNYWKWLRFTIPVMLFLGLAIAPMALPILPVKTYINYAQTLGFQPASSESKELAELPQFYADMFGWESLAQHVSDVYQSLPESEQMRTVVYTQNYGEAGALEFYSKKYPLPPIVSAHNAYWMWGYGNVQNIETIIILGGNKEDHLKALKSIEVAAIHHCEYCMPYENNLRVYIGRGLKLTMSEIWATSKHYN